METPETTWFAAMRRGDFDAAWRASDAIMAARAPGERCWHLPRHEQWVWDGRSLDGQRVLVRCYHGLGDTIQFARFLSELARLARQTTVWAQSALIPLLQTLAGAERMCFRPLHDDSPEVDYDVDVEIMELGHALRVQATDVGRHVPYLQVSPGPRVSARFTIGLVLETGSWDDRRALPRALLERLRALPQAELCSLQLESRLPGVRDLSTPDMCELASRLRSLDLVITADTMLAHLAGALAVPTWTLLPADADWRWQEPRRRDSPWYPTMRLFRQPQPGSWEPAIEAVLAELAAAGLRAAR